MTTEKFTITVNGRERTLPAPATVFDLLRAENLHEQRVAVEVNKELVTAKAWRTTALRSNDRVEIVTFVGGG